MIEFNIPGPGPFLMKKLLLPMILFIATLVFTQTTLADTDSLFTCRQIANIESRVACYDKIVDSLYPLAEKVQVVAPLDAQSLFGKNGAESKRIVEKTLAIKEIKQIEAKVIEVQKSVYKKLTVTLDNGQVWRQLDNKPLPLKSGETVVVRAAYLGSFLMEKQSGGVSIRVKRLN